MTGNGNLTWASVLSAMTECELIMRPWLPLVGLIDLHVTTFCPEGDIFAVARTPLLPESRDFVLCHSREALSKALPKMKSDDERAAYVWWCAEQKRKVNCAGC